MLLILYNKHTVCTFNEVLAFSHLNKYFRKENKTYKKFISDIYLCGLFKVVS